MPDSDILHKDPMETFKIWFEEVLNLKNLKEPRAMTLSTLSKTQEIHSRVVLLKEITDQGLIFYTNYNSSKGQDLKANPQAEVNFYWDSLSKQVRIGGVVEKTSRETSVKYWNSRPRESQLSQYVSLQSTPVKDRETLVHAVEEAKRKFNGEPVPCPEHWGGYVIKPNRIELWVGSPTRLHDRYSFRKDGSGWTSSRLYP